MMTSCRASEERLRGRSVCLGRTESCLGRQEVRRTQYIVKVCASKVYNVRIGKVRKKG